MGLPDPFMQRTIVTPKAPSSVVICRSQQCAPARVNMTRQFLYNSLLNLFDSNLDTTVLLCDADPNSRMCFENYLQFNIKAGVTPAHVVIDSAKILSVKLQEKQQTISVALDYNMHFNAIEPICLSSTNSVFVRSPDYILMEDTGYQCKFTTTSHSMISTVFAIDYIDLDYGVIGANYSFGVSGPAYGGGTGYMLMRFKNNAFPSDPKVYVLPRPEETLAVPKTISNRIKEGEEHPYPYQPETYTPPIIEHGLEELDGSGTMPRDMEKEKEAQKEEPKKIEPDIAPGDYKVLPIPLK